MGKKRRSTKKPLYRMTIEEIRRDLRAVDARKKKLTQELRNRFTLKKKK